MSGRQETDITNVRGGWNIPGFLFLHTKFLSLVFF